MAVGNQETAIFFPNNRGLISPTRSNGKPKAKNVTFNLQAQSKLQLDLSPEAQQGVRGWQMGGQLQQGTRGWNSGKNRNSPSKQISPVGQRMSPTQASFYAGFTESPAPGALPKPPSHWVIPIKMATGLRSSDFPDRQLSQSVKTFLDVHA